MDLKNLGIGKMPTIQEPVKKVEVEKKLPVRRGPKMSPHYAQLRESLRGMELKEIKFLDLIDAHYVRQLFYNSRKDRAKRYNVMFGTTDFRVFTVKEINQVIVIRVK